MLHLLVKTLLCVCHSHGTCTIRSVSPIIFVKEKKRLRYYTRHCEPPNHTNINVVLNRIRVNQGQNFARKFILVSWTSGMRHRVFKTYLLTPWSRVLLENLTGFQLVKKFPIFYGTRRFITAVTSARHLSLS